MGWLQPCKAKTEVTFISVFFFWVLLINDIYRQTFPALRAFFWNWRSTAVLISSFPVGLYSQEHTHQSWRISHNTIESSTHHDNQVIMPSRTEFWDTAVSGSRLVQAGTNKGSNGLFKAVSGSLTAACHPSDKLAPDKNGWGIIPVIILFTMQIHWLTPQIVVFPWKRGNQWPSINNWDRHKDKSVVCVNFAFEK